MSLVKFLNLKGNWSFGFTSRRRIACRMQEFNRSTIFDSFHFYKTLVSIDTKECQTTTERPKQLKCLQVSFKDTAIKFVKARVVLPSNTIFALRLETFSVYPRINVSISISIIFSIIQHFNKRFSIFSTPIPRDCVHYMRYYPYCHCRPRNMHVEKYEEKELSLLTPLIGTSISRDSSSRRTAPGISSKIHLLRARVFTDMRLQSGHTRENYNN